MKVFGKTYVTRRQLDTALDTYRKKIRSDAQAKAAAHKAVLQWKFKHTFK